LYPNSSQAELIQKTFGCVRFVYNQCLSHRIDVYNTTGVSLSRFKLSTYLYRTLKPTNTWLREVDKWALDNAIINLNSAFQKFFNEHRGFPKFKSKKQHYMSYKTNYNNNNIEISTNLKKIKLPKLGWVKLRGLNSFNGKLKSATISQDVDSKYYISIHTERDDIIQLKNTNHPIGIDLGSIDYVVTSDGVSYNYPKYYAKAKSKLIKLQRIFSRKTRGSKNCEQARIKYAKACKKVRNQRIDFQQKLSTLIIQDSNFISVENLDICGLMQDHHIAESVMDNSWRSFVDMLQYKADWYGRQFVKINRWFPSSQTCSCCGFKNPKVKDLSVREWICPNCGATHDRDINAAKNILRVGLEQVQ
jgi:putative transposase